MHAMRKYNAKLHRICSFLEYYLIKNTKMASYYRTFSKILRETSYRVITVSDIPEVFSIDFHPNGVVIALVSSNFCLYSVTGKDCLGSLKLFLAEEGEKLKVVYFYPKIEVNS